MVVVAVMILLNGCTVVNNLYVNNPESLGSGNAHFYGGIGSGMAPKIDSVANDGKVVFSENLKQSANLCFGGQVGLYDNLDLRFAMHLPRIIGGFGLRVGPQYSFFGSNSDFQMAIGADLGFVLAKDSIRIFGSGSDLSIHVNGALNADFFLPMGIRIGEGKQIVITPRYSLNTFFIRRNENERKSRRFSPELPSLALGFDLNRLYLEASVLHFDQNYFANFGLVYQFGISNGRIE
jgi:hypothetical protein